jgi:hypothetical protein
MSATGRGSERCENDFYATPSWTVDAVLPSLWRYFSLTSETTILEPCAGNGAIIKAVNNALIFPPKWFAIELREEEQQTLWDIGVSGGLDGFACPQDFLTWNPGRTFDVGLTNVPFYLSCEFVAKAVQICRYFVTLQRLNWLGSEVEFHDEYPSDHLVLEKRPKFRHGISPKTGKAFSGDNCEYAWFVFGPGCGNYYERLKTPESHPEFLKMQKRLEAKR